MDPRESPFPKTTNEPKMHPLLRKSFTAVPSAGARYAPELLVTELMREVFFNERPSGTRELKPDAQSEEGRYIYSRGERAVLHALRGRRKLSKQSSGDEYFAPAYGSLAREGWFGKRRERVIKGFLFSGPLNQAVWSKGFDSEAAKARCQELITVCARALTGANSYDGIDPSGCDILSVAANNIALKTEEAQARAEHNLSELLAGDPSAMGIPEDELAERITQDLVSLCKLEASIPRMQWVQLLMTFLRLALPVWLLATMRITSVLHEWAMAAVHDGAILSEADISESLQGRNRGLLHPTLTPTREVFEHTEAYMKRRVELNILLYCIDAIAPEATKDMTLFVSKAGARRLTVDGLLAMIRNHAEQIRETERYKVLSGDGGIATYLAREGEGFAAWRNPLKKGQGKNIDEFFRVLYRYEEGDDAGGFLLTPEGRGQMRGFRVFPGQMMLKTVTFLAAQDKRSHLDSAGHSALVLNDVEEHFAQYGVDFSTAADARPRLMAELQAMGLLMGSPDAGSSVEVSCPF